MTQGQGDTSGGTVPLLIAQITDIHLGFDAGDPDELNRRRLDRVLAELTAMRPCPDVLIATGDLTDHGDADSYRRLGEALSGLPFPVLLALGNHDKRDAFRDAFPHVPVTSSGHVQHVHDIGPLRIVTLDTLEEGRHGGGFCADRARWLAERLAEAPDRPTLLVGHHPPVETGIPWMTTGPADEPWMTALADAIAGQDQVVGLICGHIHRSLVTGWQGRPLAICSSSAPQVALELAPIDPDRPDDRPMIVEDAPAYALHYWNGRALVTHFATAARPPVLAAYTDRLQPLVRHMLAEHGVAA